jgi:hypothetical protein
MIKQTEMLEIGKAGEHLALFEIICQGYKAFLSDQGMIYDIVVDVNGRLLRGQVKSTIRKKDYSKSKGVCRFGTRRAKKASRLAMCDECDFYAFVCLESKQVGFLPTSRMISEKNDGKIKPCIEIRQSGDETGRSYSNGNTRKLNWAITFQDIGEFKDVADSILKIQ